MHTVKNTILLGFLLAVSLGFLACAGSQQSATQNSQEKNAQVESRAMDKQASLELMFQNFLTAVRSNASADTLYEYLTDTSEYWLDTLENHARTYDGEALDTCQFYEAYAILLYRLYEREHLWQTDDDRMLFMMLSKSGVLDRFVGLKLGPMKVKNDRGSIGLAKSPDVPVMLFEWDDSVWKLNLAETIPLMTKGVESIAVKKKWSNRKLALYWLEKEYHMQYSRLDDSLFEPVGF
ncbi:MAG: hypothetical protein MJY99_10870 [Fibrobacter sp.]|uniref:hypothetical protein n=1 Tax=Fibrobacter sp. TaxID=35828 RepID=UPI00388E1933|nr:hypothetical protein [Fibrobacter sp.]